MFMPYAVPGARRASPPPCAWPSGPCSTLNTAGVPVPTTSAGVSTPANPFASSWPCRHACRAYVTCRRPAAIVGRRYPRTGTWSGVPSVSRMTPWSWHLEPGSTTRSRVATTRRIVPLRSRLCDPALRAASATVGSAGTTSSSILACNVTPSSRRKRLPAGTSICAPQWTRLSVPNRTSTARSRTVCSHTGALRSRIWKRTHTRPVMRSGVPSALHDFFVSGSISARAMIHSGGRLAT